MITLALKQAAVAWTVMLLGAGPYTLEEFQRMCAEEPGSLPRYFPAGVIENQNPDAEQWWNCKNSRFLARMQERQLWPAPRDLEAYRFLWDRFGHLIVIRLEKRGDHLLLVRKEADVHYGFEPGPLLVNETRSISREQWLRFKELLKKAKSPEAGVASYLDSSIPKEEWTLEGIESGEYHVDVWYQSSALPPHRDALSSYLFWMAGIPTASGRSEKSE